MKTIFYTICLCLTLCAQATAQEGAIFSKGEKAVNVHHVGSVWLKELNAPDSIFNYSIAVATFDPGSYLYWHTHPGGQILLITEGNKPFVKEMSSNVFRAWSIGMVHLRKVPSPTLPLHLLKKEKPFGYNQ